jgi:OOP family OmpA-OmpF porin
VKKGEVLPSKYANVRTSSKVDFLRKLLNSVYMNVYFDLNKKIVQEGSSNSVNYLIQFIKDNQNVSFLLRDFEDETGEVIQNQTLS